MSSAMEQLQSKGHTEGVDSLESDMKARTINELQSQLRGLEQQLADKQLAIDSLQEQLDPKVVSDRFIRPDSLWLSRP
jgi:hypothetical protein